MTHPTRRWAPLTLMTLLACPEPSDDKPADDTGTPQDSKTEVIDDTGPTDSQPTTDSEDTAAEAQAAAEYAAFFDPTVLQDIELTLSPQAIDSLKAAPELWVSGGLRIGALSWTDVGVRLRGGLDGENWDGKPAFKLKLDELGIDNDYAGLERIVLDNLEDDRTQVRLILALNLLQDAGVAAPRASFASLLVNGEPYGLYANIEDIDGRFVDRHYTDDGGDLWEALDSADFTTAGVNHFQPLAGTADRQALEEAASLVAGDDFYVNAAMVIDLDQFLTYWAWMLAIGSTDSYPYDLNDYFVYDNPEDGRLELAPWAVDEGWDTGMHWDDILGTLGYRCRADVACLDALKLRTTDALLSFEAMNPSDRAQRMVDLVEAAVQTDPRRTEPLAEVLSAQAGLTDRVGVWADRVRVDMGL